MRTDFHKPQYYPALLASDARHLIQRKADTGNLVIGVHRGIVRVVPRGWVPASPASLYNPRTVQIQTAVACGHQRGGKTEAQRESLQDAL